MPADINIIPKAIVPATDINSKAGKSKYSGANTTPILFSINAVSIIINPTVIAPTDNIFFISFASPNLYYVTFTAI